MNNTELANCSNEKSVSVTDKAQDLTPRQIVEKLDSYIIGQKNAKKAVVIIPDHISSFHRIKCTFDSDQQR